MKKIDENLDVSERWLEFELFMANVVLADVNQDLTQFQNDMAVAYTALHDTDRLILDSPDDECFAYSYLLRKKAIEQDSILDLQGLIAKREFLARVIRYYISHIENKD